MTRKRRIRRTVGDVVAIPLGDGRLGYALVLEAPLMAFFDFFTTEGQTPPAQDVVSKGVAFRILVMHDPVVDGKWPVIGHVDVPARFLERPLFAKKDRISGRVTLTLTGAEEILPTPGQAERLENAAVWSENHVVDRLRDHFDGRPNKWVESLRIK